jgi:prepilin-type N-terminal cleavage/methylation domain-containing protein
MLARRRARGFTLVELLVSLAAGLMVALAVFAISKDATATFHEEARTATAEMSIRVASERVRADLMRAGFMGSPNIWVDHNLAYDVNALRVPATAPPAIQTLQGIRLLPGNPSVATLTNANPEIAAAGGPVGLELTGNMTSTDIYAVRSIIPGGSCGGHQITLQADSPSMWRVMSSPDPQETLRGIFQPVPTQPFLVRVEDLMGKSQFVPLCAGNPVAVVGNGVAAMVTVDVATGAGIGLLDAAQTHGNGGVQGQCTGCIVNPVHTIRYEVRKLDPLGNVADTAYAALQPTYGLGYTEKYDLVRSYRDLQGVAIGATEVVAEYVVDMSLTFLSDLNPTTTQQRPLTAYTFGDPANMTIAGQVGIASQARPQRIRSARLRISTRAATADRNDGLMAPIASAAQGLYPLRYCMNPAGCVAGAPHWARIRSMTTEVSFPNHAKSFD